MSEIPRYDVAVIGYGPTGVTAANLLGAQGLKVVVVERDAEVYTRARAISTDEEVLRVWQQVGLADELQRDMLAGLPIDFVDHRGRSFLSASFDSAGHGYPPQLFIYQPVLEATLREGVTRFPNVDLLLAEDGGEHLKRVRASWVIAADGGSSPTRGQLGIGFDGRTYETRWVVIDTKVKREWPGHDRLLFHCDPLRPAVDCPTPLGHHRWEFPVLPGEDENELVTDAAVWRLLGRQGITRDEATVLRAVVYSHHVRAAARWRAGRVFLMRRRGPRHAAVDRPGHGRRSARRGQPVLETRRRHPRRTARDRAGFLRDRAQTARARGDAPRGARRQAHHRTSSPALPDPRHAGASAGSAVAGPTPPRQAVLAARSELPARIPRQRHSRGRPQGSSAVGPRQRWRPPQARRRPHAASGPC